MKSNFLFVNQGSAVGKGTNNGSYKGCRYFTCPEACGLLVPVSHIQVRHWTRTSTPGSPVKPRSKGNQRSSRHLINGHRGNNDRLNQQRQLQQQQLQKEQLHHQQQQQLQQQLARRISVQQPLASIPPQPLTILSRTTEATPVITSNQVRGPASPQSFHVGQRVCFPHEDTVHAGEVRFCGPLPGRSSTYVGILLVSTNLGR